MREHHACLEVDCTRCGRSRVVLAGDASTVPVCHRCRMLPGWQKRPEIVAAYERDEVVLAVVPADIAEDGRALQ